jgi:flagellar L-ring protein precursor FlgH
MRAWIAVLTLLAAWSANAEPVFTPASPFARLFCDRKAYRVGDILTVIIQESSQASHQASRQIGKESGTSVGPGTGVIGMIPVAGFGGKSKIDASGTTTRSGSIAGRMTVTVVGLATNGNLMVEGERKVRVNKDFQTFRLYGEVRPRDVRADNSVLSQSLADAAIEFEGSDPRQPGNRAGLIEQILNFFF